MLPLPLPEPPGDSGCPSRGTFSLPIMLARTACVAWAWAEGLAQERACAGNSRQREGAKDKGCYKQCSPGGSAGSGGWAGLCLGTVWPSTGWSALPEGQPHGHAEALAPLSFCWGRARALPHPLGMLPAGAGGTALFVGPQEPGHLGAQQFDEGAWEHLFGLLGRVLEVVLGVRQHVEECLDQLLVLQDMAGQVRSGWAGGPWLPPSAVPGGPGGG